MKVPEKKIDEMTFGERLCYLRKTRHQTQKAMGDLLHLSAEGYAKYERGDVVNLDLERLKALADHFNVSMDFLIMGKDFECEPCWANPDIRLFRDIWRNSSPQKRDFLRKSIELFISNDCWK